MVTIPQDIIYNIIEEVANLDLSLGANHARYNKRLLKKCALVSSSFLLPCRKHLFSRIILWRVRSCQRLHKFLVENPVVQSFVRSISISLSFKERLDCPSLIALLRLPFCCLESFSFYGLMKMRVVVHWNEFSDELKDALSTVIHSPTLKTLCLEKIRMPTMLLLGINLTKLKLTALKLWLDDFDGKQSGLLPVTQATSEGLVATAPHAVVDHCVWEYVNRLVYGPAKPVFLPFMCRLRVLEIYIDPCSSDMNDFTILSFFILSLRVSLTSPATLEHLMFNIVYSGRFNRFTQDEFFHNFRDHANVWRDLDSIITHPTGSRLQRVDIHIKYDSSERDEDDDVMESYATELLEPVLDALPLLRKKGILFVKATEYGSE